jgi:hypothetical protein
VITVAVIALADRGECPLVHEFNHRQSRELQIILLALPYFA